MPKSRKKIQGKKKNRSGKGDAQLNGWANKQARRVPTSVGPNPFEGIDASEAGKKLGEAFGKILKAKLEENPEAAAQLADRVAESTGTEIPKPGSLSLRTPDFQGFRYDVPGGQEYGETPTQVNWGWHVRKDVYYPIVMATQYFDDTDKYEIIIDFGHTVKVSRGDVESSMALAECLVSAADWKTAWATILGEDMSAPSWEPYTRESKAKESEH